MSDRSAVTPLLFSKRKPAPVATSVQYRGTDTELDIKGAR